MSSHVRILGIAGSLRLGSYNPAAWQETRLFVEVTSPGSNYSRKRTIFMLDSANLGKATRTIVRHWAPEWEAHVRTPRASRK